MIDRPVCPSHPAAGRSSRRQVLKAATAIAAGAALTRRLGAAAQAPPAIPLVSFTAIDFAFDGPATITAGFTMFRLINRGRRAHMLGIVSLANGKGPTDLLADTLANPTGPLPDYVTFVGGPDATDPGGTSEATVNLAAGSYAVVCNMPDGGSGQTHLARGMVRGLTALAPASDAQAPPAAVNLQAAEFSYSVDTPITAGRQTIHFQNTGQQQHEAQLAKLPDGVTVDQYIALNDATSADAGSSYGGSASIPPGQDGYFSAAFAPGHYAIICFATDPTTGKAHFELGQIMEFTVS